MSFAGAFSVCGPDVGCASSSYSSTFDAVAADALSGEVFVAKHRRVVGCRIHLD